MWHLDKNSIAFNSGFLDIENHLAFIKLTGRQQFLELNLSNFSRINHDYSDLKAALLCGKIY